MSTDLRVYLGWDPREEQPYRVAVASILRHASSPVDVLPIRMSDLQARGWYRRQTERRSGRLWDVASGAPMSTEHAIARFFVPHLAEFDGWVVSADCDILLRGNIAELFALADDRYAVMVVKHQHNPSETVKMDGQIQTAYARKNWSSVVLWQCAHPSHRKLTVDVLNLWPGRDLHAFKWLSDDEIGALPLEWNHLVGVVPPNPDAKLVHFTMGTPDMPGYERQEFADEWLAVAEEPMPC